MARQICPIHDVSYDESQGCWCCKQAKTKGAEKPQEKKPVTYKNPNA